MKLEGELRELRLLPHLLELADARFTGAIRFENDGIIKILYFKEGDVLSASTNDRNDSVDEILLRAGKITRDHLRQALGKRKDNETLGDALLALGFIARKELTWARRVQVVGILRSVQAWGDGSFQVVQDYLPKREEGTIFYLPQIILELIVTEPDRAPVERGVDGGAAVLRKTPQFDERYGKLALNEDADAITREVDGEKSAAEIAAATQLEAFAVYKLLMALETLGMLDRENPQVMDEVSSGAPAVSLPVVDPAIEPLPAFDLESAGEPHGEPIEERYVPMEPAAMGEAGGEDEASPEPVDDPFLRRRSSRNATLFLIALLVLLGLGAWGGYRWWSSRQVMPIDPTPAADATEEPGSGPPLVANETGAGEPIAMPPLDAAPAPVSPLPATETAETATAEPAPSAPAIDEADPLRQRYQRMAEDYARQGREVAWAVQFEIVCQTESVTRAIAAGENVWFVPVSFRGQPCFRVFWGRYGTRAAASEAVNEIPASLRGGSALVVQPREILR